MRKRLIAALLLVLPCSLGADDGAIDTDRYKNLREVERFDLDRAEELYRKDNLEGALNAYMAIVKRYELEECADGKEKSPFPSGRSLSMLSFSPYVTLTLTMSDLASWPLPSSSSMATVVTYAAAGITTCRMSPANSMFPS